METLQVIVVDKAVDATTCGPFSVCYGVRQPMLVVILNSTTSPFEIRSGICPIAIEQTRIRLIRGDRPSTGQKVWNGNLSLNE